MKDYFQAKQRALLGIASGSFYRKQSGKKDKFFDS
jgi:hypothetical protein